MNVSRQGVPRIADALEEEGLVACAANPNHERAKLVCLSAKGIAVVKELAKRQIRWANEVSTAVSSQEIDAALRTLRGLRVRLESGR
jgi:DNA-binding MarR family transcriptional regulator